MSSPRSSPAEELTDHRVARRVVRQARARSRGGSSAGRGDSPPISVNSGRAVQMPRMRDVSRLVEDEVDQLEQRRLCPVQVLEDEDERDDLRAQLEDATQAPVELALRDLASRVYVPRGVVGAPMRFASATAIVRSSSRSSLPSDSRSAPSLRETVPGRRRAGSPRPAGSISIDRPVRDAFAVREAASAEDERRRRRRSSVSGSTRRLFPTPGEPRTRHAVRTAARRATAPTSRSGG